MSDEIYDQGSSSSKQFEVIEPPKSPPNLLSDANLIKIDKKLIFKLSKDGKNVKNEVKSICKVLHFSSEWSFEEVLTTIDGLDPKEYPQLFIFIIEATNLGFSSNNQDDSSAKVAQIHQILLKFSLTRPMILQLTSEDENMSKFYYKEENSNQFVVVDDLQHKIEDINSLPTFLSCFLDGNLVCTENNAAEFEKLSVYNYLTERGFNTIPSKKLREFDEKVKKFVVQERKKNIKEGLTNDDRSVNLLCNMSLIQNKRIDKKQEEEYRMKIRRWYEDINKIKNGAELLDVAASCSGLKICFDFENDTGSMYPNFKWIFVGAKLADKDGKKTKEREQTIKGVLAHELCRVVMKLVYDNQEKPYYKDSKDIKKFFEAIVKTIDKWTVEDLEYPDDECNEIISSVFTRYKVQDFHLELIIRVVQILSEFDDSEEKLKHLELKYKVLFDFWFNQVVPDIIKYTLNNQDIMLLNETIGYMDNILKQKIKVKSKATALSKLFKCKLTIISTNDPILLFIDIYNSLKIIFKNSIDSKNVFTRAENLNAQKVWNNLIKICYENNELNIFIDCTKGLGSVSFRNMFVNKKLNCIFVVSNLSQSKDLINMCSQEDVNYPTEMEINYSWDDLTEESQIFLLQTKINFQNNTEITLLDLMGDNFLNFSNLIDAQALDLMINSSLIQVNSKDENERDKNNIKLLYQSRNFVKNYKFKNDNEELFPDANENVISQEKLLLEVKYKNYVLISDSAGNGKSSTMKNIKNILKKYHPKNWVTYVDLKQYTDEFKTQMAQEGNPIFSAFMVEHILKPQQQFEEKIFQQLYNDGRVFILFDGFDEIAPNYAEFVSKLAQNFQQNGGNQLWIATRDYFEDDLMEKLQLDVAYSLETMAEDDGVVMIAKSLMIMELKDNEVLKSQEEFEKCIKTSPKYENYQDEARKIIRKFLITGNNAVGLPKLLNMIFDLLKINGSEILSMDRLVVLEALADLIYKTWSDEKGPIRKASSIMALKFEMSFWKFHQYSAIASLFPAFAKLFFPLYDNYEWPNEKALDCGTMKIKNGIRIFLHEIFRNFFIADFIIRSLKRFNIDDSFLNIFVTILTSTSYVEIQVFLNDANSKDLEKIKPDMHKFISKFYEMNNFAELFTKGLENMAGFVISILKSGDYPEVKRILNQSSQQVSTNTTVLRSFIQFQDFIIDFLKDEDFKDLILYQEVFQGIVQSSLNIEAFENFVTAVSNKTSSEFVKKCLKFMSEENLNGNIFDRLCWSSEMTSLKVQRIFKIFEKYILDYNVLELMKKCNKNDQNILHVVTRTGNNKKLLILWTEIEKIFGIKNLKELATNEAAFGRNILHYAAYSDEIDFHETFWTLLMKTFADKQELRRILINSEHLTDNFTFYLIESKKSAEIIEMVFKKLKDKFTKDEFEEILKSKDQNGRNLLQIAAVRSTDIKTHQFLWKTFEDSSKNGDELLKILNQVDNEGCNLLYLASNFSSLEIFDIILSKFMKLESEAQIRKLIIQKNKMQINIIESSLKINKSVEVHEKLWSNTRKFCQLNDIIELVKSNTKDNLLFIAIRFNTKEIVELTWKELKGILSQQEQIKYLSQQADDRKDIVQISSSKCVRQGVFTSVQNIIQEFGF